MPYTTIKKPSDYFTTNLWTGAGASSKTISGNNFQPDLVWTKRRSAIGSYKLYDAVRGVTKDLSSDNSNAETTASGSGYLNTFNSDGFTLVQGSSDNYYVDENGVSYVAWNWLGANGTASNTVGDITSTVSANTTSGFSIVSYTGTGANATVGHGLGATPSMVIVKNRDASSTWITFHKSLGNTDAVFLNLTNASTSGGAGYWNNTSPTSSVFSIGTDTANNVSGNNHIAYCFAEKQGYSKFGSYTGNGSTDGTFVYTGFKPALVILKRTDSAGTDWNLVDNKRAGYNPDNYFLAPNQNGTENSVNDIIDLLSNGFKLTSASGASNASGGSYIYMAFADEPLVGDNPATAR